MPAYGNKVVVGSSALPAGAATAANQITSNTSLASIATNTAALSFKNYAANNAGDAAKTGAGVFGGFTVNKAGVTSTLTVYDGIDNTGTKIGTFDTTALRDVGRRVNLATGLFVVLAGGTAADVTVFFA